MATPQMILESAHPVGLVGQGPVSPLRHDAVARILANGSAAFFESCAAIGWKDCDSVRSL